MRLAAALTTGLVAALVLTGCSSTDTTEPDAVGADATVEAVAGAAADAEDAEEGGPPLDITGSMVLEPSNGPAGTEVTVVGEDLPADETLELWWSTVDCDWQIQGEANEEYHGRTCTERRDSLERIETDGSGSLEAVFTVPDDFGFAHDVVLTDDTGTIRNKALFSLGMEVSISPESGPVGTPITIEVKGMGWQTLEDTRTILYDNRYVGFMSAVTTQGTARAVIPATGAVGPHRIYINRGAYTFPYLNPQQSPRPDIPSFTETFTVTEGDAVLPPDVAEQAPDAVAGAPAPTSGPAVAADLLSGPVGSALTFTGIGMPAGADVSLLWYRIVGNRVSGQGWDERSVELGTATSDGDGAFTFETTIPGDVGGPHRVEAVVDGEVLAETSVAVTPQADPLASTSVAWGEELTIHLTGVGWTETANIYTVVYDNAYVGYACGFNTQGDVVVTLDATGAPGWHFIDLYPAIYKGEETRGRNNFRIPQLTYADDHPGEDLPAFRFAFRIEE